MSNAGRVIVNVSHIDHTLYFGQMGTFKVLGRGEPGNEVRSFGTLVIPETLHYAEDKGWGDPGPNSPLGRNVLPYDGKKFAQEILQNYIMSFGDNSNRKISLGIFIAAGEQPTEEELIQAEAEYVKTLEGFFDEANSTWNRTRNVRLINDLAKLAAKVLGIKAEWAPSAARTRKIECPACGDSISPTLAIHRRSENGEECGYILDTEKAKRMIDFSAVPEAPRKRTPKPEAVTG